MTAIDLIEFRRRFKLTQPECARALGCSPRSITEWEAGRNSIPDSVALAASAFAMGLPKYGSTLNKGELNA